MANKVNKIFVDSSGKGYAVEKNLTTYGSMFGLSGGDLEVNKGFIDGFGLFEFGANLNEITPSNSTLEDIYLEYDGNGDLIPKA